LWKWWQYLKLLTPQIHLYKILLGYFASVDLSLIFQPKNPVCLPHSKSLSCVPTPQMSAQWSGHCCSLGVSLCFERTNQCPSIVKQIANNKQCKNGNRHRWSIFCEMIHNYSYSIHLIHDIFHIVFLWNKLTKKLFRVI